MKTSKLIARIEQQAVQAAALKTQNRTLAVQNKGLRARADGAQTELKQLQEQLETATDELACACEERDAIKMENHELRSNLACYVSEIERLRGLLHKTGDDDEDRMYTL